MDTDGGGVSHKITGTTITTPMDILKSHYLCDPWRLYIDIIGSISVIILLTIISINSNNSIHKPYVWIMVAIFVTFLFRPIYLLSTSFVELFTKRVHDKRKISYEIDGEKIFVRLASGTSIAIPWSDIRKARIYTSGLALQIRSGGYWWISKRAFSEEAMGILQRLAQEHVIGRQG